MKYPIIFKGLEELGLKNIYSLIKNKNQYGGDDSSNDSPSGVDVINDTLSLDSDLFEKYCKDYEKIPHILPAKKRIICLRILRYLRFDVGHPQISP